MDPLFFIPVAIMLALVPGPNNFCALNNGIRQGIGMAMLATFGRVAAFAIFLTVSAVGLGAMLLAGCLEQVPGLGPDPRTVIRENEAKAIGSGCRHAMRGIEDCYTLNPKAPKSMVFAGWKDMDEYMREHKLEGTPSVFTQKPEAPAKARAEEDIETEYARPRS